MTLKKESDNPSMAENQYVDLGAPRNNGNPEKLPNPTVDPEVLDEWQTARKEWERKRIAATLHIFQQMRAKYPKRSEKRLWKDADKQARMEVGPPPRFPRMENRQRRKLMRAGWKMYYDILVETMKTEEAYKGFSREQQERTAKIVAKLLVDQELDEEVVAKEEKVRMARLVVAQQELASKNARTALRRAKKSGDRDAIEKAESDLQTVQQMIRDAKEVLRKYEEAAAEERGENEQLLIRVEQCERIIGTNEHILQFVEELKAAEDPRSENSTNQRYPVEAILFIIVCAMGCGAEDPEAIWLFAWQNMVWIDGYVELRFGIPLCSMTIRNLINRLNPLSLSELLISILGIDFREGEVYPIDGKRIIGSQSEDGPGVHMISVYDVNTGATVSSLDVGNKGDELNGVRTMLNNIANLNGAVITADALSTHEDVAAAIVAAHGFYMLPLKDNQKNSKEAAIAHIVEIGDQSVAIGDLSQISSWTSGLERAGDRVDERTVRVFSTNGANLGKNWPELKNIVWFHKKTDYVSGKKAGRTEIVDSFFITNLECNGNEDARRLAHIIRSHWAIENILHWRLDASMGEDACQVSKKPGAICMNLFRKMALYLVDSVPLEKMPIKETSTQKRFAVFAMSTDYLSLLFLVIPIPTYTFWTHMVSMQI